MSKIKKKILHIVGDSSFGGASFVILSLAEMARTIDCQVDILTNDRKMISLLTARGFGVLDVDLVRRRTSPLKDFLHTLKLALLIRSKKYDLVHTHTTKGGLVGRLAAKLASCDNIVHTVHGFAFHEETTPIKTFIFASIEKVAALWCHHIITVSNFHRDWAIRLGISKDYKLIAIPNGIPLPHRQLQNSRALRCEFDIDDQTVLIFFGGRLAKQKGLEYLLESMPTVHKSCKNKVKLIIAGEGDLEDELKKTAVKIGLNPDQIFIGFRQDIGGILEIADLVVLPSLREGLSISLLEAMATGKAIITTSIGSNLEATRDGEGAIIVPPKDSESLAAAIINLCEDSKKRMELGLRAKEIYLEFYTEDRMLDLHRDLYERCLYT